jgi:hypothetical protein
VVNRNILNKQLKSVDVSKIHRNSLPNGGIVDHLDLATYLPFVYRKNKTNKNILFVIPVELSWKTFYPSYF